ncbi:MAG TPA: PilZ domain-containing protein [Rhodanobacteraceae bacterium]|nr:PilZ domain-containing protein [Rhodanobacteraceae bacterium]
MNSSEQRRATRKHATDPIEVVDALTGESLGRVGNLSRDGMMLIGRRKLNDDALYQVRFHLPGSGAKPHPLEAGVHEQWSEPAAVPGQHWAGLRIIALSDADAQVLSQWLERQDA